MLRVLPPCIQALKSSPKPEKVRQALIISMSLTLLPLAFIGSVSAHGGVVYPPIWQAGASIPLDEIVNDDAFTDPPVRDPNSGRAVKNVKSWLTDQAYTGGIGDQFKKEGPITNDKSNKNLRSWDRCRSNCMKYKNPWAAPGQAPTLGGEYALYLAVGNHVALSFLGYSDYSCVLK